MQAKQSKNSSGGRTALAKLLVVGALLALCSPSQAATQAVEQAAFTVPAADQPFVTNAVPHLLAYLRIDTVNPPGNESRGVAYLAKLLEAAGIEYETAESAPGRGNIWARIPGGRKPALVLLHHIDVVPSNQDYWDTEPLSGEIRDGYLYGRGALDTKGLGIAQLEAFLALHASGRKPSRDVIFLATADEEAGGEFGAGYMVREHASLFRKVGFLLNEGGGGSQTPGGPLFSVEATQKVPLWLKLVARGNPGHGSAPQAETAVTRLVRALHRISQTKFPARAHPAVADMFAGLAPFQMGGQVAKFAQIEESVKDANFLAQLQLDNPPLHALLRNTCSMTRLQGSAKINVVPAEVTAELDCRLLPDQDPAEFTKELAVIINDPAVEIEKLMGFSPAVSSIDTALFKEITELLTERYPGSRILPSVAGGFTDSHFFRDMGIVSYGFAPFVLPPEDRRGIHGNNERILVSQLEQGTATFIELLRRFTR